MCVNENLFRVRVAIFRRHYIVAFVAVVLCGQFALQARAQSAQKNVTSAVHNDQDRAFYSASFSVRPKYQDMVDVGRELFNDPSLSASGKQACASCHDPKHAYGPASSEAVMRGGEILNQPGVRAVPSLRYLQNVPPFTEHFFESDGNDSEDQGPTGGHTWDGRAPTVHDQARLPLFSRFEMANRSESEVIAKVISAKYAELFKRTFGGDVTDHPELVMKGVLMALETFQQDPQEFYPYSSKYDQFLQGKVALSAQEMRGLALFNDPEKGNCAACHPSGLKFGALPQFTDYGYQALGVPRNPEIAANRDNQYFDMGLCGPLRTDLTTHSEYCGLFKVPSLRNVSLRKRFFHNGKMTSLNEVMDFYASRDSDPVRWYGRDAAKQSLPFNDLPEALRKNVSTEAPFDHAKPGHPAFSKAEAADIIAFLNTLTDGYTLVSESPAK